MLEAGDIGVQFFFVLSGFLIKYLILIEINSTERLNVPAFYLRRSLRIWPLYYAVVAVGLVLFFYLVPAADDPTPGILVCFLCFLSNFSSIVWTDAPMWLGVTWSVAIEEQFYLVWPLLFAACPRRFHRLIFAAVIVLSLGFRAV